MSLSGFDFEKDSEQEKQLVDDISKLLQDKLSVKDACRISAQEEQIEILIDESKANTIDVLNTVQSYYKITDMKLMEISTESIIRKIYEAGEVKAGDAE